MISHLMNWTMLRPRRRPSRRCGWPGRICSEGHHDAPTGSPRLDLGAPPASCPACGRQQRVVIQALLHDVRRASSRPGAGGSYESHGDPTDHMWLCSTHRAAMQSLLGTPSSPGRPSASAHDQRVTKYRTMAQHYRARRSAAPTPPRMSRPGNERPGASAPQMSKPSIWS